MFNETRPIINDPRGIMARPQAQPKQRPTSNTLADTILSLVPFGTITQKALTGRGGEITPGEVGLEAALTLLPFGRLAKAGKVAVGLGRGAKGAEAAAGTAAKTAAAAPKGAAPGLYGTGQRLLEKSSGLQIGKEVGDISKLQEANELFRRHGITGTPRQQLGKIQTTMNQLGRQVEDVLATKPVALKGTSVRTTVNAATKDPLKFADLDLTTSGAKNALKAHSAKFSKLGDAQSINKYVKKLNPVAIRAQDKLYRGITPTGAEVAALAAKRAGDEVLSSKIPEISPLKKEMAILFERNPEVTALAQKAPRQQQILGTTLPVPQGAIKGAESLGGRALTALGGPSIPARITRQIGGQVGRRAVVKPFVGGEQPPSEEADLEDVILQQEQFGAPAAADFGGGLEQPEQSPYTRESLAADIQRDPKNAAKYLDYYKNLQEVFTPAVPKLSMTQQKGLLQAQNAASLVDQLEGAYQELGGGQGRLGGGLRSVAAAAGFDNPVDYYNQVRESTAAILARAFGEVGTMTDADIKRAVARLPKVTDTPEVANRKLQDIKQLIGSVYQNTLQTGGSAGGNLEEALLTAGGY